MKIFVDTANLEEIREAYSWGIVNGVTTNPSLIYKASKKYKVPDMIKYLKELFEVIGKEDPVSLEVISKTQGKMYDEAMRLYDTFNGEGNVVIKIPVNPSTDESDNLDFDGLKCIYKLNKNGVKTNATLIFTPEQAMLSAKAGANYVSPFAGRVDDKLRKKAKQKFEKGDYFPAGGIFEEKGELIHDDGIVSGADLVKKIMTTFSRYPDLKSEVIAASMRNPRQVREVAETGVHIATIPFPVLKKMLFHDKTVEGMIKFSEDADKVPEYKKIFIS